MIPQASKFKQGKGSVMDYSAALDQAIGKLHEEGR